MSELPDNPMGTDGFEFVEYTAPDPQLLRSLFERLGFPAVARHRSKNVTLHRQGEINFIINAEPQSFAQAFARVHGPSACAMAFRVRDAAQAYARALSLGAKPGPQSAGPMELNIPSIEGIGGSLIYLVDLYGERSIYDVDFRPVPHGSTEDIYRSVDVLRGQGVAFQDTPDTYYEGIAARVPGHREALEELRRRSILIDGNPEKGEGVLLQIFTQNVIGPIFFEIIQRKGNEGFGEGNFRALFESIELDQIRRGVLQDKN